MHHQPVFWTISITFELCDKFHLIEEKKNQNKKGFQKYRAPTSWMQNKCLGFCFSSSICCHWRAFPIPGLGQCAGFGWDGVHFLDSVKIERFLSFCVMPQGMTTPGWIFLLIFIYWAISKCRRGSDCYPERPASWCNNRAPMWEHFLQMSCPGKEPGQPKMTVQVFIDPFNKDNWVSVEFHILLLFVFHQKHKRRFYFLSAPARLCSLPSDFILRSQTRWLCSIRLPTF